MTRWLVLALLLSGCAGKPPDVRWASEEQPRPKVVYGNFSTGMKINESKMVLKFRYRF
jgi:hypothetical protein